MRTVSGSDAFENLRGNNSAHWKSIPARLANEIAIVAHKPKFNIERDAALFCIGSCFARNIEEHLIYSSRKVLSKRIVSPADEWPYRSNGFVNKFTTAAMLNEIEWAIEPPSIDERLFEQTPSGWIDRQLTTEKPVSLDRAKQRRAYLIGDYFARMRSASIVIVTLGLTETWWDDTSQRYLNVAPTPRAISGAPGRYRIEFTDVQHNLETLENIRRRLKLLNPAARIIISVSPVPMNATFSGQDVLVANMQSKSTLRVAAYEFANRYPDVDYFPSYDMIAMAPRSAAYGQDCLHVSDRTVGAVIRYFLQLYTGEEPVAHSFNELGYLAANPDVEEKVRLGTLESGFEHWIAAGRAEGRPLLPKDGPTKMMILAGAV